MTRSSPGQQGLGDTKVSECAVRAARRELASSLLLLHGVVLAHEAEKPLDGMFPYIES